MITLIFCLRRLASLSRTEFQEYWLNTHGPLVRERAARLKMRRYAQLHSFEEARLAPAIAARGETEPYDGVAQASWDSLEALLSTFADPAARTAGKELLADERRFIDLARSPMFFTREHVFVP